MLKNGLFVDYNGCKRHYKDGKLHRVGGPAVEYLNGSKQWFYEDKLHRIDAPAIECVSGNRYWYIDGVELSEEDWKQHPLVIESRLQKVINESCN